MLEIKTDAQSRPLLAIASHAFDSSNLYHLFPPGEGTAAGALGLGAWEVAWRDWGKAVQPRCASICLSVKWARLVSSGIPVNREDQFPSFGVPCTMPEPYL